MLIYENLQLSLLWLCHVSIMFVKLTLPFHARRLEASVHKRYIHAACLTITLLLPIIPVAAMFATGGFTMATFPPFLCFPRNGDITYYLLNLPVSIVLSTGTAMLIVIMWNIHKVISAFRNLTMQTCGSHSNAVYTVRTISPS